MESWGRPVSRAADTEELPRGTGSVAAAGTPAVGWVEGEASCHIPLGRRLTRGEAPTLLSL